MHYAWVILICCCLIEIGSMGAIACCLGLYLVPVCAEFDISAAAFSLYLTIQYLSIFLSSSFCGKMMARFGVRKTLIVATVVNAVWFWRLSQAQSIQEFYVMGALIGITFAMVIFLPVPTLVSAWFEKKQGFAMGIAMTFAGIGGACFSVVFAKIIEIVGWRMSYQVMALVSLVLILPCALFFLADSPEKKGCLAYGKEEGAVTAGEEAAVLTGLDAAGIYKRLVFWSILFIVGLTTYVCNYVTYIPAYGISLGLDVVASGTLLSATMLGNLFGAVVLGFLTDCIGVQKTFYLVDAVILLGTLTLILGKDYSVLFVAAIAFGISSAINTTMIPLLVQELCGKKDYGTIYAYVVAGQSFIGAVSCVLIGWLYDVTSGYVVGLIIAAAACVLLLLAVTFVFRRKYYET